MLKFILKMQYVAINQYSGVIKILAYIANAIWAILTLGLGYYVTSIYMKKTFNAEYLDGLQQYVDEEYNRLRQHNN